jgi:hypothetical protein
MGHLGKDNIRKLAKMVDGMSIRVRTSVGVCEACWEGKQHRQLSHQLATRATKPLELIHSDLCGPINPTMYSGTNYYLLFTDDYTRMTHIYPLKKKSSAEVLEKFRARGGKADWKDHQAIENRWRQGIQEMDGNSSQKFRNRSRNNRTLQPRPE